MDDVVRHLIIFRSAHRAQAVIYLGAPKSVGCFFRLAPHARPLSLCSYMNLRMPLENKNIEHNEVCFICGVYCSIVILQSTATKKQDYISTGAQNFMKIA